jgi:anti-anti-sigma regulatory factor
MLRITEQSSPAGGKVVVLEGRLVGPWVPELRRVIGEAGPGEITVDLEGVSFADENGVAILRSLRDSGVRLARSSGFLAALIRGEDADDRVE